LARRSGVIVPFFTLPLSPVIQKAMQCSISPSVANLPPVVELRRARIGTIRYFLRGRR
jgi:hypothetical protein